MQAWMRSAKMKKRPSAHRALTHYMNRKREAAEAAKNGLLLAAGEAGVTTKAAVEAAAMMAEARKIAIKKAEERADPARIEAERAAIRAITSPADILERRHRLGVDGERFDGEAEEVEAHAIAICAARGSLYGSVRGLLRHADREEMEEMDAAAAAVAG